MEERDASPGPSIAIERPDVTAVEDLVDLWVALASDQRAHDSHVLPEENRAAIRETLARHAVTGGIRIARSGDETVGFVTFGLERGSYEQDVTRGVVHNVYVAPEHRNAGIGSALMDAAETALRAGGATVVSLEAMARNERAREFYRERGYRPHRVLFEKPVGSGQSVSDSEPSDGASAPDRRGEQSDAGQADTGSADGESVVENDTHSKED
ncbi:GNAT family N-acetyltransferase [Halobellus sp. GM3]|uniref:GNAT family N-acetyltransferase n=1 Tax=Halobellus sp. GM3 TaxID=3458410 RepID=UPI00403DF44A